MKYYLKVAAILGAICAIAAIILAAVNAITAPRIDAYEAQVALAALKGISGDYQVGEKHETSLDGVVRYYYELYENEGTIEAYALELSATGYGGPFALLASFTADGEIIAVQMLSNNETPGIGKKAEASGYMDKFIGTGLNRSVPVSKNELSAEDAQAVSGATVTFTGISKALAYGSEFVKTLKGGQK